METNTAQSVLDFIEFQLDKAVAREMSLDALGLDSLELLDLQLECEKRFGKHVPDALQGKFSTVGDFADFFS